MIAAKMLLDKKREGLSLSTGEIQSFIAGFTTGEIPDYQMAAMAMAICCRGMDARETADLVAAMQNSGRTLTWRVPTADKHSTGGVGDKLSLVIQPLAASCGVFVPSLTGRGLGLTGGTADKLESIPGYSCSLSLEKFQEVVTKAGVSMAVQTDEITPADKKLYALRDVTGTVASIPLIVGSILSKKLAEGSDTLVFDVKTGVGTFMRTEAESVELATALVEGARANGRKAAALVTDMNEPLGYAVGNANEVAEAIEILKGRLKLPIVDLCVEFAALMVALEKPMDLDRARELCRQNLENGAAYARFEAMVEAHGGSLAAFGEKLASPVFKFTLQANQSGFVGNIDAHVVAKVAFQLGAGRAQAGDRIDDLAGVTLQVSRGDKVAIGAPLATICSSRTPDLLERNAGELLEAFSIVPEKPQSKELIVWRSST